MPNTPFINDDESAERKRRVLDRLDRLNARIRGRLALEGAARTLGLAAALGIVLLGLDWWLELSRPFRVLLLLLSMCGIACVAWREWWRPLRHRLSPLELAALLDSSRDSTSRNKLAPRIATALQSTSERSAEDESSPELAEAAIESSLRSLSEEIIEPNLNAKRLQHHLLGCVCAVAIPFVLFFAMPDTARLWMQRWLLGSNQPWPRDTRFEVVDLAGGRLLVPSGETTSLRVLVHDEKEPTETVWIRLESVRGPDQTSPLTRFREGDFRFELPPTQQPMEASLWGGDGRLGPFEIVPVDRPRASEIRLTWQHPRDAGPQSGDYDTIGADVRWLPETKASIEIQSSAPVKELRLEGGEDVSLDWTRLDHRTFRSEWTHRKALSFSLRLIASEGGLASHPIPIAIGLKNDRPPQIRMRQSGVGQRITPAATIPLNIVARDDFGLDRVSLNWEANRSNNPATGESQESAEREGTHSATIPIEIPPSARDFLETTHRLEVAPRALSPGDLLHLSAQAADDCYTGAQSAGSSRLSFHIVSQEELFRDVLIRLQELRARLRTSRDQADRLREDLLTTVFPDDASGLIRNHRLNQREVWRVRQGVEESVVEMRLNQLGGKETLDLMERDVVTPLRRLHDAPMARQQQALEALGQGKAEADSAEEVFGRQEEIVEAISLVLRNMEQWDSFVDIVNQLNTIIKIEKEVKQRTESLKEKQVEDIFIE